MTSIFVDSTLILIKVLKYRYIIVLAFLLEGFSLSAQNIPTNGLLAYYPFSGNANDASGNAQNGTPYNVSAAKDRFGNDNSAYSFGGNPTGGASYISIPSNNIQTNNFSYSAWYYTDVALANNSLQVILDVSDGQTFSGQAMGIASNLFSMYSGPSALAFNQGSTTPIALSQKKTFGTGKWVNVVLTRADKKIKLFVNGKVVDSSSSATTKLPQYGSGTVTARIGLKVDNTAPSIGNIDDVAIWNRELSVCEIEQLFSNFDGSYTPKKGISKAILQRACLDRVNSELTLELTPSQDTSGHFQEYKVWGRDNASGSFQLLSIQSVRNQSAFTFTLPNNKKWELFVSSYSGCLKIDSVNSNRIWIDDKAPDYVEPDSVSVEDATQQLIAGWSKPADTDILGYSMFKVDNQNTLIDEKNVLNYRFLKSDFDVTTSNNRLAIAGFDSCRNGGVISADHSPVLLSANLSNKYQCDRKLNVSWKEYKGWLFSKHQLIIVDAVTGAKLFDSSFAPGSTNFIWTLPKLGLQMKIWVRAYKQTGSITSTSNRKDLIAYDVGVPSSPTSLYYTSVENEPKVELSGFAQIGDSCVIRYREKSTALWQLGSSIATSPGNIHWEFIAADAKTKEYEFRLVRFSGCGEPADSSKVSSNILLRKNGNQLQWNAPDHFLNLGISYQYEIQRLELGSWAVKATVTGTNFTPTDLGVSTYRVRAITSNSMPLGKNWSHSNSLVFDGGFDSSLLDTFFIPDAFTPEGVNPIFKVVNQAVLPGQARMLIFNRWGEVIFDGDALEGWNGQVNGDYVSDGVYVYLINARYRSRIVKKTGTLLLLR